MRKTLLTMFVGTFGLAGCAAKDDGNSTGLTGTSAGSSAEDGDGSGEAGSSGGSATGGSTATSTGTTTGTTTATTTGATTSTTSTGGTSSSTGSDTDTPFIVMPDGGGTGVECDIWTQDCPDGTKCMPWANDGGNSWNATKCTEVDPAPKQLGDECMVIGSGVSGTDNCGESLMCWNADEMGVGYCVAFCGGTSAAPTCESQEDYCTIYNNGVLPLCLSLCDPLLQDCPTDRDLCVQAADGLNFVCVLDASGTTGNYGDPCEYVNSCKAGLFCASAAAVPMCTGAQGCCSEYCDVMSPDGAAQCMGSAGGQECVAWFAEGMAPPGYESVGGCAIPT